jgi:steroid delta-isomerase
VIHTGKYSVYFYGFNKLKREDKNMEAQEKVEIVNKYINSISSQDMDGIREIYDEQATVEDPIGTDAHVGIEAVCKFYEEGFDMGVKLELTGPVRCAGNAAAFPFVCYTAEMKIEVIDIFEFNENGKIKSMRAYWGPDNYSTL